MYSLLLCALIEANDVGREEWKKFLLRRSSCHRLVIRKPEWHPFAYKWEEILMSPEAERIMLVQEYLNYAAIVSSRGLANYQAISEEELRAFTTDDIRRLVRHAKDLARTPSE